MQQKTFEGILRSHRLRIELRIFQISSINICDNFKE